MLTMVVCLHFLQYSGRFAALVTGKIFWSVRRPQIGQSKKPSFVCILSHSILFCNTLPPQNWNYPIK